MRCGCPVLQSGLTGDFVNDAMAMFGGANGIHSQLARLFGWDKALTATVSANEKVRMSRDMPLGLPPVNAFGLPALCVHILRIFVHMYIFHGCLLPDDFCRASYPPNVYDSSFLCFYFANNH